MDRPPLLDSGASDTSIKKQTEGAACPAPQKQTHVSTEVKSSYYCADCSIKFESATSLSVHRAYHQSSLLCRWTVESSPPRTVVSLPPALPGGGGGGGETAVESPPPARSPVSSGSGPAVRPGSMQISMAQSMGIQQGAPPHLGSHHTSSPSIFPSPEHDQSEEPLQSTPSLPSINADVSEFFSQLESGGESGSGGRDAGATLQTFPEEKSNGFQGSTQATSQYSGHYSGMEAPPYNAPGSSSDFLGFGEGAVSTHDQSSEGDIWDMDSHTVRRYNPVPDPVSPGPIPTTPTMYGVMGGQNSYSYSRAGLQPPLSPGLTSSPWAMGMKGQAALADAKRPKTYQCEACDKW